MFCPTAATDGILPPFFPFSGLVYQLSDSFRGFFRLRSHRSNFGHETRSRLRKQRENAQDENRLTVIACLLSPDILDRTCPGRLSFSHVDRDLDPISSTAYFNFSFSLSLSLSLLLSFSSSPSIHTSMQERSYPIFRLLPIGLIGLLAAIAPAIDKRPAEGRGSVTAKMTTTKMPLGTAFSSLLRNNVGNVARKIEYSFRGKAVGV